MGDPRLRDHPSLLAEIGELTIPELDALHERIGRMLKEGGRRPCFELAKRRASSNATRCRAQGCATRTRSVYWVPLPTGSVPVALCGECRYKPNVKLKPNRPPDETEVSGG